ncbi:MULTISPECIES: O-methyltransferase [Burkholderia]|uniref:O-methyltransferase n=1 Tax=Burkholderia paludis TaxID=1506587 RepID=A0A6J5ETN5_9BURK|nr:MULTISPECIES: class I SAM-dependent methyltransferase [Burkholderia]CAB3768586.1 tRNA 5-hydroxyuridine methyltransferase [Burkholderia paludis]VWC33903.1 O-methyltransferase [Burkholderia paludis]
MPTDNLPRHFIGDTRIDATLHRLYAATLRADPPARQAALARGLDEGAPGFYDAMKDAYLPVTPDFGMLLHLLVRTTRARMAVEFGTSFGISTIWIAAALRANGGGRLVTTEMNAEKADGAHRNLCEAGLDDLVEIRTGLAEHTLRRPLGGPLGFVLLDGEKSAYLPVLQLLEPDLATGAPVVADNTGMAGARAFLDHVREPRNGYRSADLLTQALGALHPCTLLLRG